MVSFPSRAESSAILVRVLERHRGERHAIVLQDFPDPDAISSGFAHQLISARLDITADLLYYGKISHPQNRALVQLLNIPLLPIDEAPALGTYRASVFVDNQGTTSSLTKKLEAAGVPPLLVIDHHEEQHALNAEYSDVRKVGATATLYAEYLEHGALELDRSNREHVACATALMHGLLTDTQHFARAREADLHAAEFLSRYYDPALLDEIVNQPRSRQLMDMVHRALENRKVQDGFSIAGIGYVTANERDAIPQAADFLVTEENVHTAIVYGLVVKAEGEESIVGSLRTQKATISPDRFLKEAFGKSEGGAYFGGGRSDAGGFEIPLGFLSGGAGEDYRGLKWLVYDAQVRYKLSNLVGASKPAKKTAST